MKSIETYMMAKQSDAEHTEEMWSFSRKLDEIRNQDSARFLPIDEPFRNVEKSL